MHPDRLKDLKDYFNCGSTVLNIQTDKTYANELFDWIEWLQKRNIWLNTEIQRQQDVNGQYKQEMTVLEAKLMDYQFYEG